MDITEVKWPARRRRGRYSNEFKREIVKACQAPGVSTASVELTNGINANLLRR
jgi:transposase